MIVLILEGLVLGLVQIIYKKIFDEEIEKVVSDVIVPYKGLSSYVI